MNTENRRSNPDYEALASSIEDGDYTVLPPVVVHRGRPRNGESRVAARATSVRLPEATLALLEELAAAEQTTTSELIRTAANEFLARRMTVESTQATA